MAGRKYPKLKAGEWVRPTRRGYRLRCCDCGLVHIMDFKLIPWGRGKKILFRFFKDNRATAAVRRKKNK